MKRILFLALTIGMATGGLAFAGVVNGGGGKGILCGGKLRVLDLYEGELQGYPKPISQGNFETDLKNYSVKAIRQFAHDLTRKDLESPRFPDEIAAWTKEEIINKIIDIPAGQTLEFTKDATLPPLPSGCSFVQIAINVIDRDAQGPVIQVYRDRELWNLLPALDQIALLVHEILYWRARFAVAESSSDDIRLIVSRMFSGLETYEMFAPLWDKPLIECFFSGENNGGKTGQLFQFLATAEVEAGVSGTGLYFGYIGDKMVSSRTRAFLPNLNPDQLLKGVNYSFQTTISNPLLQKNWSMQFNGDGVNLKMQVAAPNQTDAVTTYGSCHPLE